MHKNAKAFVLAAAFLLVFYRTACPQYSSEPKERRKNYSLVQFVEKKVFLVGEPIKIHLLIKNKSRFDMERFIIQKETNTENYRIIGDEYIITGGLGSGKTTGLTYEVRVIAPGKVVISRSSIVEVTMCRYGRPLNHFQAEIAYSNPLEVTAKRLDLFIRQEVWHTNLLVDSRTAIDLDIQNDNDLDIQNIEIQFEGDTSGLELVTPEEIPLPRRQYIRVRLTPRAIKAGEIELGRAIVKRLKIDGTWIHWKGNYGASNPAPKITVSPVRLPGIKYSLRYHKKEISSYFSLLILKIPGIAVALLAIVILFMRAIQSKYVDSFGGRIILRSLMVLFGAILLILLAYGFYWCWLSTLPDLMDFAIVYAISCAMTLFTGAYLLKNAIWGSAIAGGVLTISAYLVYVGYTAMENTGFNGVPFKEAALLFIVLSIALNISEFKRR
jgi:hypothetical protein